MAGTQFDAFLSYSKRENETLAQALHSGLHRLAKPWYQLRAVHVFRLARLDIHQDRAVVVPLAQRELVHPEHSRRRHRGFRQAAYQPQERRPARPDRERVCQARAVADGEHHCRPL
ncbi:hypothetical protein ABZ876_35535 [Streptomyces sp. NPDC046931]|uniref:hypothetical protein n=1 Tax=Streptomyces sp. NPDC046931 TaxID=3154806 RepID=UPI0033DE540B